MLPTFIYIYIYIHFILILICNIILQAVLNPMASKNNIQVLLFLLSLSTLSLKVSSLLKSENEEDYNSWISWNVNNFRNKYNAEVESTLTREPTGIGSKVLDLKLRNAEMNKVRINVSQDGTGDFKSIKEALDSIPLHNTKRVILTIKPGVYRYNFYGLVSFNFHSKNFYHIFLFSFIYQKLSLNNNGPFARNPDQ